MNTQFIHKCLNELLGFHDCYSFKDQELLSVFRSLADKSKFHFDGSFAWKIDAWRNTQEQIKRKEVERIERDKKIEIRKAAHYKLKEAIIRKIGADEESASIITERVLSQHEVQVAAFFGVDIEGVPMDMNHVIVIGHEFYKI